MLLALLQGSRIVQRYIDYKKLQRLMKDISGFSASQRMEGVQPMMHIQPKQVQQAACGFHHYASMLKLACSAWQTTSNDADAVDAC